ncbi:MAG: molybdopterin-dependent oxidoreductase [Rhodoferax sp.]|uniref:molybdopterin-dependent oxidoreductase n=1 Tax=Rhodoferax sp. TaxID=50421 RepID=UPI002622A437|nr:molybdopterin cofactor-binding domain-containing protein [Rhodoferax sp.]MDD5334981.1 molybdopterin-dependent oxidoreductase [Rhodoferax sp.]
MNDPLQMTTPAQVPQTLRLNLNGKTVDVLTAPSKRLSDVLRDDLGLTGTKIGCHAGDCGACTVLLDGEQVCACITPVGQCVDRVVTTVEGLACDGQLNRLQQAFLAHGAAQCGICTPGMLMAASDVLRRYPDPTEQQVQDGLGGVLCRCTGYRKIIEAVLAVARGEFILPQPPAGQAVGARLPRLDGVAKITGAEKFGADHYPPDCLWLRTVRSPHARATFTLGDLDSFKRRHPQVVAVFSAKDVPENSFSVFPEPKDQPVLAEHHVRMRGEAVLLIVGAMEAVQAIAESDIPITWQPEAPLDTSEKALAATGDLLHDFAPENVLCRGRVVKGDVATSLRESAFMAEDEYRTGYVEHAYIEPEAGYAEVFNQLGEQRLRVFVCTQTPVMDRDEVAHVLKLPKHVVHIVPSAIGGGFGGKLDVSVQPLLALAAWLLKRPVRTVYSRAESMQSTTKRHPSRIRARFACDAQGQLTALDFHGDFNTGAYASWGSTVANRVPVHATGPYYVPNLRALTRAVYTNNAISGAFRGFGVPQAHIVTEALLDELAEKVGIDQLEFRLKNAIRAGQPTATGQVLQASVGMVQCLEALRPAWHGAQAMVKDFNRQAEAGAGVLRRGVGIASMWYGIGNTVIANPSTMTGALRRNGRLFLYNGAQEIGQGSGTVMPQIFADAVGLPVALVDQVMGDTDLTEDAGKSSASRQTFVSGNAAKFAGEDIRQQLLQLLGLGPNAMLSVAGTVVSGTEGGAERHLDLGTLPANQYGDLISGRGYFNPPTVPLDANGQGVPYACYGFAAQIAEVEVDIETGTVKVLHIHAAHDVGRAINPTQVEGQIHGGVAQGLGLAMMEEYISGRTDNLHDYMIPTVGDVPPITVHIIEDKEPLGPYGAKGVGEPALVATAPAILNAIYDAIGVRVRQIPATPDRVRRALLTR